MPLDGERRRDVLEIERKVAELVTSVAVLGIDVGYIKTKMDTITLIVEKNYITRTEFSPVKNIVYGMVGLILLAVMGSLVALAVKK